MTFGKDTKAIIDLMKDDPRPEYGWCTKDIKARLNLPTIRDRLKYLRNRNIIKKIKRDRYTINLPLPENYGYIITGKKRGQYKKKNPLIGDKAPYLCEYCGEPFSNKYLRRNHVRGLHYNLEGSPDVLGRVIEWLNKNHHTREYWMPKDVADALDIERYNAQYVFSKLLEKGLITRIDRGQYKYNGD